MIVIQEFIRTFMIDNGKRSRIELLHYRPIVGDGIEFPQIMNIEADAKIVVCMTP